MTGETVVVTGGAGYVGSVVVSHLLLSGFGVVVVDRLAAGGEAVLSFSGDPRFRLEVGDVRDSEVLGRAMSGAGAVVHLAAVVGEPACAVDVQAARGINVDGTKAVLAAIERAGIGRLVMVSTCSNYGMSDAASLADEDAPLHPRGVYAESKVEAERMALAHRGYATVVALRLGTICGLSPRMRFDLLVNDMARAAALGESISVYAPEAWRPFLHIRDAARVIEWCLRAPAEVATGVFNVVGENYQKKGLMDLVRRHYADAPMEMSDGTPDPRDYRVSGARILARGGFTPRYSIEHAFLDVASAVRAGVFRNPHWRGHAAAAIADGAGATATIA